MTLLTWCIAIPTALAWVIRLTDVRLSVLILVGVTLGTNLLSLGTGPLKGDCAGLLSILTR